MKVSIITSSYNRENIIAKTKCAFFQNEMCIFCIFFRGFPARS